MKIDKHLTGIESELRSLIVAQLRRKSQGVTRDPDNLYHSCHAVIDKALIDILLEETNNNQTRMAKILGVNRGSLQTYLKKYGYL